MSKIADIKIGYACNDECVHCVVEELRKSANLKKEFLSTAKYKEEISNQKKQGVELIVLTGGEPTIYKDFFEILKFIHENDMKIHIQSNGRKFSNLEFVSKANEFISSYEIALHGPNKEIHEKITQTPLSFEETVLGLKNLVKLNTKIEGKIVLSKYNYSCLVETLNLYKELGVKFVTVAFAHSSGEKNYINDITATYKEIKPYIEKSLESFNENELFISLENILPCALDKQYSLKHFQDFYQTFKNSNLKLVGKQTQNWLFLKKAIRKKDESVCKKCLYNTFCEGYWKEYVEERGFSEFTPIEKIDSKKLI